MPLLHPLLLSLTTLAIAATGAIAGGVVANVSTGLAPLPELLGTYQGEPGGLYPGGTNAMPTAHHLAGLAVAAQIVPRDADGSPAPDGKIVVVGLGMSNATQTFATLALHLAPLLRPGVVFVDLAQGGQDVSIWAQVSSTPWTVALERLAAAGVTPAQVQVVLHYHAVAHSRVPVQAWPATPLDFTDYAAAVSRHVQDSFPNTRLAFWSTREYGGYATGANNPEPLAYQTGFGVRWLIERQLDGDLALNHDPARGPVEAAWMAWGPYTWADGLEPSGTGLTWESRDFQADGTHPRQRGRAKLVQAWLGFLLASPHVAPWLRADGNLPPRALLISPEPNARVLTGGGVALEAATWDPDGEVAQVEFLVGGTPLASIDRPPWLFVWADAPVGSHAVSVRVTDTLGAETTSPAATVLIGAATPADGEVLASDGFESGDLDGGTGWVEGRWTPSGNVVVTNAIAPPEGSYQLRLYGGSSVTRTLTVPPRPVLGVRFRWKGQLPGGTFTLALREGSSMRVLFSQTNVASTNATLTTLPLTPAPAPGAVVELRATGAATGSMLIDDLAFFGEATTPPRPPVVALTPRLATHGTVVARFAALPGTTQLVEHSTDLTHWRPWVALSPIEEGTVQAEMPAGTAQGFLRLRSW